MQARIHRLVSDRTEALAAVSHDLRSPIQRLRLRAGFLEDAEAQRAIDADLDEMEGMVEATLAYLRGEEESEALRQADLAAILGTLCDDWADRGAIVAYAGPDRLYVRLRPLAIKRKRGDEARLPARAVNVLGRSGAGSFGLTLWSTLLMTRRVAGIVGSRS